jgi:hypothetical protein
MSTKSAGPACEVLQSSLISKLQSPPIKVKFSFQGKKQVVLWFRSDSNEAELCAKEWEELVEPLPELFDLPRGSRMGVSVVDKSGDVVTLCVRDFLCVHCLNVITKIDANLLEVIPLDYLRSREVYQNNIYDCIQSQWTPGMYSQLDSINILTAISDPCGSTEFCIQFFTDPTQSWRL